MRQEWGRPDAHAAEGHHRLPCLMAHRDTAIQLQGLAPEDGDIFIHGHHQLDAEQIPRKGDGHPPSGFLVLGNERIQFSFCDAEFPACASSV